MPHFRFQYKKIVGSSTISTVFNTRRPLTQYEKFTRLQYIVLLPPATYTSSYRSNVIHSQL